MRTKLTEVQVKCVRDLFDNGIALDVIAKVFQISRSTVYRIIKNHIHHSAAYTPQPDIPLDETYCRSLRERGLSYVAISEAEARKSKRIKPFSSETIRYHLKKGNSDGHDI